MVRWRVGSGLFECLLLFGICTLILLFCLIVCLWVLFMCGCGVLRFVCLFIDWLFDPFAGVTVLFGFLFAC